MKGFPLQQPYSPLTAPELATRGRLPKARNQFSLWSSSACAGPITQDGFLLRVWRPATAHCEERVQAEPGTFSLANERLPTRRRDRASRELARTARKESGNRTHPDPQHPRRASQYSSSRVPLGERLVLVSLGTGMSLGEDLPRRRGSPGASAPTGLPLPSSLPGRTAACEAVAGWLHASTGVLGAAKELPPPAFACWYICKTSAIKASASAPAIFLAARAAAMLPVRPFSASTTGSAPAACLTSSNSEPRASFLLPPRAPGGPL